MSQYKTTDNKKFVGKPTKLHEEILQKLSTVRKNTCIGNNS